MALTQGWPKRCIDSSLAKVMRQLEAGQVTDPRLPEVMRQLEADRGANLRPAKAMLQVEADRCSEKPKQQPKAGRSDVLNRPTEANLSDA